MIDSVSLRGEAGRKVYLLAHPDGPYTLSPISFGADHGQLVEGISALAVPIVLVSGDVAGSIATNMTSARLKPKRLAELLHLLRSEVGAIEEALAPGDVHAG